MTQIIATDLAPQAIGTYSQAVRAGDTVYVSGQVPLEPETMALVSDQFDAQARQVFKNLSAICEAAGGSLAQCVKLTVYLTDLGEFAGLNEVMQDFIAEPYPARAAIEVSALPKDSKIEIDAIMYLGDG